ncbi:MAG TPA: polysaccharide pyruvyl transferase family protein [Phycisphaerales bacterium]|mgnify:CR=1 FL=1|nr:polysaccharide pyruvyl transferase family protein [Phycisphaerales bacterium]HMP37439.1 polysaccharide pyruvyl transferase family protein [Phycisphaerales bacterium]
MNLKTRLRRHSLRFYASLARNRTGSGALIVPTTGPGSLGEEAMIVALAGELARRGAGPISLMTRPDPGLRWPPTAGIDRLRTVSEPGGRAWRAYVDMLAEYERVFVIGADCLDGTYSVRTSLILIDTADLAARCGRETTIVGSSYKPDPDPQTVRALGQLSRRVRLCARDELSFERMRVTGAAPRLVADVAFLLEPDERASEVAAALRWGSAVRGAGGRVLGVNVNHQVLKSGDRQGLAAMMDGYSQAIERLLVDDSGLHVLFLPHDYRTEISDLALARTLRDRLAAKWGDRLRLDETPRSAAETKALAGAVDVVLTGRMHLAIAAMGLGIPPACVTYQGKFEGLFRHFGITSATLDPGEARDPERLAQLCRDCLDERAERAAAIAAALPAVRARSLENLPESLRSGVATA